MKYRELLELYDKKKLPEELQKKVEQDIERQEAISEYLFEKDELGEELHVEYNQSEEYDKVLELAKVELGKNPDNMVMRRLAMYSLYELKKYEDGIKHGDHLMQNNKNFIPRDHIYYGRLLNKIKRNQEAVVQFKEALELEPDNLEIYKELSQALESNGQ